MPESSSVLSLCLILSVTSADKFLLSRMSSSKRINWGFPLPFPLKLLFSDEDDTDEPLAPMESSLSSILVLNVVKLVICRSELEFEFKESIDPVHDGVGRTTASGKSRHSKWVVSIGVIVVLKPSIGRRRLDFVWQSSPTVCRSKSISAYEKDSTVYRFSTTLQQILTDSPTPLAGRLASFSELLSGFFSSEMSHFMSGIEFE